MQQLVSSQTLTSTNVACRVYFMTSCTGLTSPSESSTSLLSRFASVWRTKLRVLERPLHSGQRRQQPTLTACTALSANYIRPSGFFCCGPDGLELTTDWFSRSVCRFWCFYVHSLEDRCDISASSAIEMYTHDTALYKFPISILPYSSCPTFFLQTSLVHDVFFSHLLPTLCSCAACPLSSAVA